MQEDIRWKPTQGGECGAHRILMMGNKFVGHLYPDSDDGVDCDEALDEIARRHNSHDDLVSALHNMSQRLHESGGGYRVGDTVIYLYEVGDIEVGSTAKIVEDYGLGSYLIEVKSGRKYHAHKGEIALFHGKAAA